MKTTTNRIRTISLVAALLGMTAFIARGEAKSEAKAPPAAPASAGSFQSDFLALYDDVEKKVMSLEEATPQDKFKWRPAPGVRSIAEAYMHIAFGNYGLTKAATGKAPAADVGFDGNREKWDTKTTDKAQIKAILQKSFDHVRAAVKEIPDADLDKKVSFFGHQMSERAVLMVINGHVNEHLGQEVAYARSNNIVPPWSEGQKH